MSGKMRRNTAGTGEIIDFLNDLFDDLGKVDFLSKEDERVLARKARLGDVTARNELVERNLPFVIRIAQTQKDLAKYKIPQFSLLDLINERGLALIKAAENFDERKGFRFLTYAGVYVKGAILDLITKHQRAVTVPAHIIEKKSKIRKTATRMVREAKLEGRKIPTWKDVADEIGLEVEEIGRILGIPLMDYSVEGDWEKRSEDHNPALTAHIPSPEQNARKNILKEDLTRLLDKHLSPREAKVLKLRFGLQGAPQTLEAIGKTFRLSKERIRQVEAVGVGKLKSVLACDSKTVQHYLDGGRLITSAGQNHNVGPRISNPEADKIE